MSRIAAFCLVVDVHVIANDSSGRRSFLFIRSLRVVARQHLGVRPRYRSIVFALAGIQQSSASSRSSRTPPPRSTPTRPPAAVASACCAPRGASPPPRLPSPLTPRAGGARDAIILAPRASSSHRCARATRPRRRVAVAVARDDDDDDALGARARIHATRERARADEIDDAAVEVARATTATRSMRARRASTTTSGR